MHVPALAPAQSVRAAQELADDRDRVDAAHHERRRPAMVQGHRVAVAELRYDAGGDGLLTGAEVHFPRDQALAPEAGHGLFDEPAPEHQLIKGPSVGWH